MTQTIYCVRRIRDGAIVNNGVHTNAGRAAFRLGFAPEHFDVLVIDVSGSGIQTLLTQSMESGPDFYARHCAAAESLEPHTHLVDCPPVREAPARGPLASKGVVPQ